jgi:hypothetical protein
VILTLMLESEDQKTKDKGALGSTMDLWLTKDVGGFEERNQFYLKYAQKLGSAEMLKNVSPATMSSAMSQDPRMGDAMQTLSQKAKALEGEAVLTVMSFNLSATPSQGSQPNQASSQSQAPRQEASSQESEAPESVSAAIEKALGGFGGFGRKKKKEPPPQTAAQPTSASGGTATATLMTMTTEMKSFSKAALDAGLFEVPASYKLSNK